MCAFVTIIPYPSQLVTIYLSTNYHPTNDFLDIRRYKTWYRLCILILLTWEYFNCIQLRSSFDVSHSSDRATDLSRHLLQAGGEQKQMWPSVTAWYLDHATLILSCAHAIMLRFSFSLGCLAGRCSTRLSSYCVLPAPSSNDCLPG